MVWPSFEAQSVGRLNARRATGGDDDGRKCRALERQGGDQIGQWIGGRDTEDERRSYPAESDCRNDAEGR
jgi:hypothetical protein